MTRHRQFLEPPHGGFSMRVPMSWQAPTACKAVAVHGQRDWVSHDACSGRTHLSPFTKDDRGRGSQWSTHIFGGQCPNFTLTAPRCCLEVLLRMVASGAGGHRSEIPASWGDSGGAEWVGSIGLQGWIALCRCSAQVTLVCPLEARRRPCPLGA